jgi:hypothetical protein
MSDPSDFIKQVLEQLGPFGTWSVAPVNDEPEISLIEWSVRRNQDGYCHFVGTRHDDGSGRVSTPIVEFDEKTMRGRTASGRVYQLIGPPGYSDNGEYVWEHYQRINGITEVEP